MLLLLRGLAVALKNVLFFAIFVGIYWGSYMQHHPRTFRHSLEESAKLFAEGDLVVNVSHKYSLEQAQEAFTVLAKREVIGKLLFLPAPRSML